MRRGSPAELCNLGFHKTCGGDRMSPRKRLTTNVSSTLVAKRSPAQAVKIPSCVSRVAKDPNYLIKRTVHLALPLAFAGGTLTN